MGPADWYKNLMMPQAFTNDPNQQPIIEDVTNDPLYNALSYDPVQQEVYKEQKLEEIAQDITDKVEETVTNIEGTPFFGTITPAEQDRIREFTRYNEIEKKIKNHEYWIKIRVGYQKMQMQEGHHDIQQTKNIEKHT